MQAALFRSTLIENCCWDRMWDGLAVVLVLVPDPPAVVLADLIQGPGPGGLRRGERREHRQRLHDAGEGDRAVMSH